MVKIKGWQKMNDNMYRHNRSGTWITLERSGRPNFWWIVSGDKIAKMRYDIKKKAQNYMKNYMRANPNG